MSRDIQAKKSLGQHWLNDAGVLRAMCEAARVAQGDTVLEVGPGQGSLTAMLLEGGAKVVAVELDESLAARLLQRFYGRPFTLNMLSILDFDLSKLPKDYKVVANIPYYLTAHLLRMLCETLHKPNVAVLLVQKEVAERVTARPGDMAALSVLAQFYYEALLGQVVPAKLFSPPPKVDSQILILHKRQEPLFADVDYKQFFHIVKAGFSERRKKLRSSLSGGLGVSKPSAEAMLQKAGIDPNRRAQELSLDEWHELYKQFSSNNK